MSDNKLDSIIKGAFEMFRKEPYRATSQCPSDEELAHYITCAISDEPVQESLLKHITECEFCFTKTASTVSALTSFDKNIPYKYDSASIQKTKSLPKIYPRAKKGYTKRNRYLFIAAGFFILSFIFKGYFLQFLAAASIFGIKWVMDTGGSKALIMIYDTWQHKKVQKDEEGKRSHFIKNRDRHHF